MPAKFKRPRIESLTDKYDRAARRVEYLQTKYNRLCREVERTRDGPTWSEAQIVRCDLDEAARRASLLRARLARESSNRTEF